MSKTHYPGANTTAQYWAGKFTGSKMNTNCACLHSTEGFDWPAYGGGASAPHLTVKPNIAAKTISVRQHFPADRSSRALVNLTGGVETNTLNVFQLELIGTCNSVYRTSWGIKKAGVDYIYWPDAPDWLLSLIAPIFRWLDAEWPDFKAEDATPRGWVQYPASYGVGARQRMTFAEWRNAYGIFGHQHVPENTHGDPGNFPIAKLVAYVTGSTTTPDPEPEPIVWTEREDEYRVDITLPVYGRDAPHVDATKVTAALAIGSVIYGTEVTTMDDGDWVRSKYGTCFKASSLTLIGDEPAPEPQPEPEPGSTEYTVVSGDTLNSIAARHGLTLAQLLALNGLDIIAPGLVLVVTDEVEPEPETVATATMVGFNLKSPTLLGKWLTWPLRRGGQIKIITDQTPSVVFIQEAGPPSKVAWYDTTLAKSGLVNARAYDSNGSGRWRLIYHDQTFERIAAYLYIIGPRIDGDDKQMAVDIARRAGVRYLFGSFHLENESGAKFDTLRVDQMKDCFAEMERQREIYGIAPKRCILQGDTNSDNMVRQWVERNTDYRDAAGLATKATNADRKSANGWKGFAAGPRIDYFLVHKSTVVNTFNQIDAHKVSDHNAQVININL